MIIINILLLLHYLTIDMDLSHTNPFVLDDISYSEGKLNHPSCDDLPDEFKFPKVLDIKTWMEYLGRPLKRYEFAIIHGMLQEREFNNHMDELYTICAKKGLYIPELTRLRGDCLFESLNYHGIGNDVNDLRNSLATIMYLYKDYKNFFPTQETTLNELFTAMNDIEYVVKRQPNNRDKEQFFKYSYNIMCQDLATGSSWDLLPTQLILMVVSRLYNVDICVINNTSEWEHSINIYEGCEDTVKRIYVGHLNESHYLPIDILEKDEVIDPLYYEIARVKFIKWGKEKEKKKYIKFIMRYDSEKSNIPPHNVYKRHNRTNMFDAFNDLNSVNFHALEDDKLDHFNSVNFYD